MCSKVTIILISLYLITYYVWFCSKHLHFLIHAPLIILEIRRRREMKMAVLSEDLCALRCNSTLVIFNQWQQQQQKQQRFEYKFQLFQLALRDARLVSIPFTNAREWKRLWSNLSTAQNKKNKKKEKSERETKMTAKDMSNPNFRHRRKWSRHGG